jgi:hypothetical protein
MAKKILALCAAIMAFAVVPSVASAANSPELVESGGGTVAVGSLIEGTNIGNTLMTDISGNTLLSCDIATLTGKVSKNDGSNVEGDISTASFKNLSASTCSGSIGATLVTPSHSSNPSTNGLPWCIRSTTAMATDEFQVRGNKCSEAARPIRFILHVPLIGECTYQRTSPVVGSFSTGIGSTTLTISKVEFPKIAGSSLCPSAGFLDMTFMLETDGTSTRIDIT